MSTNNEPLSRRALSVDETARVMGLCRASVYRAIAAGKLKTIKLGARRLIPSEAIDALLRDGAAGK